jgi:hypothetical protein
VASESTDAQRRPELLGRWTGAGLAALGATSAVAVYGLLGLLGQRADDGAAYWMMLGLGAGVLVAGSQLVRRVGTRRAVPIVVITAAAMRLVLVPLEPALSSDMYRYLWDGKVQAVGINPYVLPPEDPALESLRDADWEPIERKGERTIYPPAAQATFLAANRLGVTSTTAWKGLMALVDLVAIGLLARLLRSGGRDPRQVVLYAWNPLPIMAFGLSGHVDALVVVTVVAAALLWYRRRPGWTGVLIGLAAGVKLFPLMLLAPFARPVEGAWRWRPAVVLGTAALATLLGGYLFYLTAGTDVLGYLSTGYLDEEGYTSADRFRLARALGLDGRVLTPFVAVAAGVVVLRSHHPAPTRAAWLLGAAFVLTVPFSWYTAPLIALAVAGGAGWAWGGFAILLHAAYIAIFHDDVFSPLIGDTRLSTPIRNVAAGAMVLLALAAVRWPVARRSAVWQPPAHGATDGSSIATADRAPRSDPRSSS